MSSFLGKPIFVYLVFGLGIRETFRSVSNSGVFAVAASFINKSSPDRSEYDL
jgi:hypothetical protein